MATKCQCWMAKLIGFDFDIHYKPEKDNVVADALFCIQTPTEFQQLFVSSIVDLQVVKAELSKDPQMVELMEKLKQYSQRKPSWVYKDNLLFYLDRLVIPHKSSLKEKLLMEFHCTPMGGHGGFLKTYKLLLKELY